MKIFIHCYTIAKSDHINSTLFKTSKKVEKLVVAMHCCCLLSLSTKYLCMLFLNSLLLICKTTINKFWNRNWKMVLYLLNLTTAYKKFTDSIERCVTCNLETKTIFSSRPGSSLISRGRSESTEDINRIGWTCGRSRGHVSLILM